MKRLNELSAIIECIIDGRLPPNGTSANFILFMDKKKKSEVDDLFKRLGASGVPAVEIPNTNYKADRVQYGGFVFHIVDTGYIEPSDCTHEWEEQKTTYSDKPIDINKPPSSEELLKDGYVLSRYCKLCGLCETYHGGEKKWIDTGIIKIKKSVSKD